VVDIDGDADLIDGVGSRRERNIEIRWSTGQARVRTLPDGLEIVRGSVGEFLSSGIPLRTA
jgi:hypothetical protein